MASATARPGVTEFTIASDTQVKLVRVVNAPRHLVFEAYTKPEHLKQWLSGFDGWTMPICEMEPRAGGKWRYGWRSADGSSARSCPTSSSRRPPPPPRRPGW